MEFKTMFSKHERFISNPGYAEKDDFGIKIKFAPELDKYGNKVIIEQGKEDLYAQIQSWRDECDINILMAKFTNGDKTALMKRVGAYLDISQIPDNFNDMLNLTTKAGFVFDSLPTDVKKVFGNNVNNFLANSTTEEFKEIMSKSPEDLRREKVQLSKDMEKTAKENGKPFYEDLKPLLNDADIKPIENPLVDQITETVKRKLNESK